MLFKPNQDFRAPRHALDDEDASPALDIPNVTIEWSLAQPVLSIAIVCPETCGALATGLVPSPSVVGHIVISYSAAPAREQDQGDSEYDEDAQLYAAVNSKLRCPSMRIPISANGKVVVMVIPHFVNVIATNVVARALNSQLGDCVSQWIVLAPCDLSQSVPIAYLGAAVDERLARAIAGVPSLEPPHCVLGIGAAVLSHVHQPALLLAVYAEGASGYERVDGDALVNAAFLLQNIYEAKDRTEYIARVTKKIRESYGGNGYYL